MYQGALPDPDFFLKLMDISVGWFNVRPPLSNVSSKTCWQKNKILWSKNKHFIAQNMIFVSLY